jgi:hypothetical protein
VQAGLPITAAVYGVGALVSAVGLAVLPAIIGCVVIAAALVVTAMLTVRTGLPAAYACACGVAGPAWLAYASLTTAWSWLAIVALALPAAALIWLYPVIVAREDKLAAEADRAARDAAAARVQDKWPDLLARIGHSGVRFAGQQPTRTGYVVHLRLPVSGRVTYSALAPAIERLEVAARPTRCCCTWPSATCWPRRCRCPPTTRRSASTPRSRSACTRTARSARYRCGRSRR